MNNDFNSLFEESEIFSLVKRMELLPQLVRRQQEELILENVPLPSQWLDEKREAFLGGQTLDQVLETRGWTEQDLAIHIQRPEALRRFAKQRFAPGLEDAFLASRGSRDEVIYSLLRVREPGLARELWIRLEEGETTFAEAAHQYGVGVEAQRKGVLGPMPIGKLQPEVLQEILRSLRPGELSAPRQLGEWHVLMRLEQLKPARFDDATRNQMQQEALNAFLDDRVSRVMAGQADTLEPIYYDAES